VAKLLRELPAKVPGVAERAFLYEAIKCFEAGAYRAAIVMSWNLAYDHLLLWVLKNHLPAFNAEWPKTFPTKRLVAAKREDFGDAKEAHVLQVCRAAGFISADLKKMLDEKLDKRNSAAPSIRPRVRAGPGGGLHRRHRPERRAEADVAGRFFILHTTWVISNGADDAAVDRRVLLYVVVPGEHDLVGAVAKNDGLSVAALLAGFGGRGGHLRRAGRVSPTAGEERGRVRVQLSLEE